jgi:hypothetical protein
MNIPLLSLILFLNSIIEYSHFFRIRTRLKIKDIHSLALHGQKGRKKRGTGATSSMNSGELPK